MTDHGSTHFGGRRGGTENAWKNRTRSLDALDRDGVRLELENSLRRLRVDHVDVLLFVLNLAQTYALTDIDTMVFGVSSEKELEQNITALHEKGEPADAEEFQRAVSDPAVSGWNKNINEPPGKGYLRQVRFSFLEK